jgi:Icc-related predicted phosphoesterase
MKKFSIVIISDTHNKHKHLGELPSADMIIHCGDMTSVGKEHEIHNFMKWFSNLNKYKYKICVAGNHDWLYERNSILAKSLVPNNVIYLEDNGVEIEGIKFYGTPVQKHFYNWAFNRDPNILKLHWEAIPDDTDVLITHSPPYNILDYVIWNNSHEGDPSLYNEVTKRIKPIVHCFGHIHGGRGIVEINETTFINACNLDEDYNCIHEPILLEIIDNKVHIISH